MKTRSLELSADLACIWKGSHCSMHHLLPLKMLINHKLNCNQNHWNFNQELQCRLSLSQVMSCLMLTSDFKFEKITCFWQTEGHGELPFTAPFFKCLQCLANVYNYWVMPKSEALNSICSALMGGRDPTTWGITCHMLPPGFASDKSCYQDVDPSMKAECFDVECESLDC